MTTADHEQVFWLQSSPFSRLADRIFASAPQAGGKARGESSILGGIGRVLIASDAHIGREIAIKELLPDSSLGTPPSESGSKKSTAAMNRFLKEARVTGQLEHPAIVPVYEVGKRPDGTIYYTMKFVRGKTLAQAINDAKTLEERLKILDEQIERMLAEADQVDQQDKDLFGDNVSTNTLPAELADLKKRQIQLGKALEAAHKADAKRAKRNCHQDECE